MHLRTGLVLAAALILGHSTAMASTAYPSFLYLARSADWVAAGRVTEPGKDGAFLIELALPIKGSPPPQYASPPIPDRIDTWRPSSGTTLVVYLLKDRVGFFDCSSAENVRDAIQALLQLDKIDTAPKRTVLLEQMVSAGSVESLRAAKAYVRDLSERQRGAKLEALVDYRSFRPVLLRIANDPANRASGTATSFLVDMVRLEDVESLLALAKLHPIDDAGDIPSQIMRTLSSMKVRGEPSAEGNQPAIPPPPVTYRQWAELKKNPEQFKKAVNDWQRWFEKNRTQLAVSPRLR